MEKDLRIWRVASLAAPKWDKEAVCACVTMGSLPLRPHVGQKVRYYVSAQGFVTTLLGPNVHHCRKETSILHDLNNSHHDVNAK
jgi:hypothetical protein